MNKFKKQLSLLLSVAVVASSFVGTNLTAFAEDSVPSVNADSMSIAESVNYVNGMSKYDGLRFYDEGVSSYILSDEEIAAIEKILENDYADNDGFEYSYKSEKYDFSSEYYYNQLSSDMKSAYDQLDAACTAYLTSTVSLPILQFKSVTLDIPLASQEDAEQVFRCFYYSNPQYFFLSHIVQVYPSEDKIVKIVLSQTADCQKMLTEILSKAP